VGVKKSTNGGFFDVTVYTHPAGAIDPARFEVSEFI
jgi:hypothetical protein